MNVRNAPQKMFWRNSERKKRSSEDPDDLKHDVKPSVFRKSSSGDITAVILIKTSPDLTLKHELNTYTKSFCWME